jgi:hypothetical protein
LLLLACSNAAAADETLSSAYKGTAAEKLINGLKKARGTDAEEEQRVRQSPESPKEQEALVAALLVELKTAKISSELIAKIDGLKVYTLPCPCIPLLIYFLTTALASSVWTA